MVFGVGYDTSLQLSEHQGSSCLDQERSEQQVFCGLHKEMMVWVDVRIILEYIGILPSACWDTVPLPLSGPTARDQPLA